jgi:hypothetical protein
LVHLRHPRFPAHEVWSDKHTAVGVVSVACAIRFWWGTRLGVILSAVRVCSTGWLLVCDVLLNSSYSCLASSCVAVLCHGSLIGL